MEFLLEVRFPDGESLKEVRARVLAASDDIAEKWYQCVGLTEICTVSILAYISCGLKFDKKMFDTSSKL